MKNIFFLHIIIFLHLFLGELYAQTGWYHQVSGTDQGLFGIHFYDADNGFAVGTGGTILHTTDGGNTWIQQNIGTNLVLFDISFIDPNIAYVVGLGGTILKTTDGGKTWTGLTTGIIEALFSVFFTDTSNGVAVGHFGIILKTTNGGTTWIQQSSGTTKGLRDVYFTDTNNGFIAGDDGLLLRTTDGGSNWNIIPTGIQINLHGVSFIDANTGTVVGGSNLTGTKIFRTTDGGLSWALQYTNLTEVLTDVHFTDTQTGTAVGWNGTILRTTDGGSNWIVQSSNTSVNISSVFFVNVDLGFAVGQSTILATMDGGIPVELSSFTAELINSNVVLKWQTASETNNRGFEIERSIVKNQKSETNWESIGFVEGYGTTSESKYYSYPDENLQTGIYNYRLKQIDYDGSFKYSQVIEVDVTLPQKYSLEQNYPNPFNPSTRIVYHLPVDEKVTLKVYNALGKKITTLVNEIKKAGIHEIEFRNNGQLSSGVYFYKIETENYSDTKKFILLK